MSWLRVISWVIFLLAAVFLLWVWNVWEGARAEDYWSNCADAYRFCELRPYHRDCSIWTAWGRPLSVNRSWWGPLEEEPFCRENRWHMMCVARFELKQERDECPLPERP